MAASATKGENPSKYEGLLIPKTAEGSLGNYQENRMASFLLVTLFIHPYEEGVGQ